ncbi:hypothetical protein Rmet_6745 (plasmid) [Cupriavidus metallidurans CH34]|uniref:Uncharacterized protein n=1 Tax=Cupriavidus metallidurans (strain ATCC 43123 / DSM 2839 / NBRC 102507 / CH34) TaxID=266264 RepID=D3DYF4_CUPMC|nr:hypothetical protein Rmet_6745 [Cupriavidus metallidurans CH34]
MERGELFRFEISIRSYRIAIRMEGGYLYPLAEMILGKFFGQMSRDFSILKQIEYSATCFCV